MRILFWSDTFYPHIGGVEVLGANLVRALNQRGHELRIIGGPFSPDHIDPDFFEDIPIYRFPFEYLIRPQTPQMVAGIKHKLSELKRTFRPELVHIFQTLTGFAFHLDSATAYPAPTLLTLHGNLLDSTPQINLARRRLLLQSDWIAACSHATLNQARHDVPEIINKSSAIVNALEMPTQSPAPLNFDKPVLLCLGRLHPQKGFDIALDAFVRVLEKFPRARMIIAGDGQERAALMEQATRLQINHAVEFRGWVSPYRVLDVINQATLVLMPSRFEPFGLVALQAAQLARPIIASRVDGLPEIVLDGETGILVGPENARALSDAIEFVITHSSKAIEMGRAARTRAEQVFVWERFVDEYELLYKRLAINRTLVSSFRNTKRPN